MNDDLLDLFDRAEQVTADCSEDSILVVPHARVDTDLDCWLWRIRRAQDQAEVFACLDEFRQLDWTDPERSQMSKTYVPRLSTLAAAVFGGDTCNDEVTS